MAFFLDAPAVERLYLESWVALAMDGAPSVAREKKQGSESGIDQSTIEAEKE
jgi:hypothetical protein